MKVPPKRKGNPDNATGDVSIKSLNESPSEKEGKSPVCWVTRQAAKALNESPSEKEGKYQAFLLLGATQGPSMKVPPKRKGNFPPAAWSSTLSLRPSMKVPPKRKGNHDTVNDTHGDKRALNESPSEKEGKSQRHDLHQTGHRLPSMKVPPKRKGNARIFSEAHKCCCPQ